MRLTVSTAPYRMQPPSTLSRVQENSGLASRRNSRRGWESMRRNRSIACGLLGMVLTCPGFAQGNAPAAGLYRFSIPAEPLGDALSDLAQQTGLQVMISSQLV